MIHEMQHVPFEFDEESIRKLQEKGLCYAKLIENMWLKIKEIKEIRV